MKEYNFEKAKLIDMHYEENVFGVSCIVTFRLMEVDREVLSLIDKITKENPLDFVCSVNHRYDSRRLEVDIHRIYGQ